MILGLREGRGMWKRNIGTGNDNADKHDYYYHFTIEHRSVDNENGVRIANVESLIYLKCIAFFEMTGRKNSGEQVNGKHILKYKKDGRNIHYTNHYGMTSMTLLMLLRRNFQIQTFSNQQA